jgi:hypothetical protein
MDEEKQPVPGIPFCKGDPRINRKGRPKTSDKWKALLLELGAEPAVSGTKLIKIQIPKIVNERPVVDENGNVVLEDHYATNAEMIARAWMKDPRNQQKYVEYAYGKVPDLPTDDEKKETLFRPLSPFPPK